MKLKTLYTLAAAVIIAAGCGGSGGGSNITGGTTSGSLSLFATDNLVEGYDHVWVSIKKIELISASGNKVVMDDDKGRVLDLLSLRDPSGRRFTLLSNHAINSGTFSGLTVTLDENLSIFPKGATKATEAKFDGATGGAKDLTITFPTPTTVTPNSNLIVDFDLANWNLATGLVSAVDGKFLKVVEDASVGNVDRHERDDYRGTISGLTGTAPNQTFTLTQGPSTIVVKTNDATTLFNADGSASPVLANNTAVEVYGAYSKTDNALLASKIKVGSEPADDKNKKVKGKIVSFVAMTNTITIDLERCENQLPTTTTIRIDYADTALFFGNRGTKYTVAEFEAALANDAYIAAQGTLVDGVLTASKIQLEAGGDRGDDDRDKPGRADIFGAPASVDATAGTFKVKANRWEGVPPMASVEISVKTDDKTQYGVNGKQGTAADAYAELAKGTLVYVTGEYDPATKVLLAKGVKVGSGGGGGNGEDPNGEGPKK